MSTMQQARDTHAPSRAPDAALAWTDASGPTVGALLRWVDATGDALVGVDARGRIAFANAGFARAFGVAALAPRDPAARRPLSRFVPLLSAPRLARWLEASEGAPGSAPRVHRLLAESVCADGERFLAAVTLLPVAAPGEPSDGSATACVVALRPLDAIRVPPRAPAEGPADAPDAVALGPLVDAALRSLGDLDARRRCAVALHASGARIAAEPEPVRDALVRVLDNACRHAPPGTPLAVRSRAEQADREEGADACDRIVITVADRGPGMSRAHVRRALEPFWRGDDAARTPGQGLGLAIARERIEGQRGWIELRSARGVGTEVELWLPAA